MRAVGLIAGNFLREQRWLVLTLLLYVALGTAVFGWERHAGEREDVEFFVKQMAVYAILFSAFVSASAIHNERKSRRVLAVLSKAVRRSQYLAGLMAGALAVVGIYCAAIALGGAWLMRGAEMPLARLFAILATTVVASLLVSAVFVFFTTLLNPVFASVGSAMAIGLGALSPWPWVLPIFRLGMMITKDSMESGGAPAWELLVAALVQAVLLWLAASWVFARRDVAVAVE